MARPQRQRGFDRVIAKPKPQAPGRPETIPIRTPLVDHAEEIRKVVVGWMEQTVETERQEREAAQQRLNKILDREKRKQERIQERREARIELDYDRRQSRRQQARRSKPARRPAAVLVQTGLPVRHHASFSIHVESAPTDSTFTETAERQKQELCAALAVPPSLL